MVGRCNRGNGVASTQTTPHTLVPSLHTDEILPIVEDIMRIAVNPPLESPNSGPGTFGDADTPQARYLRPFGGLQNITHFRAPPYPSLNPLAYEAFLNYTKAQGERNSKTCTPYETETAFFWRETSTIQRNRLSSNVIRTCYAKNVFTSQPSTYSSTTRSPTPQSLAGTPRPITTWRPVTAIRRTDINLPSNRNIEQWSGCYCESLIY
jgi:hypothetical protein